MCGPSELGPVPVARKARTGPRGAGRSAPCRSRGSRQELRGSVRIAFLPPQRNSVQTHAADSYGRLALINTTRQADPPKTQQPRLGNQRRNLKGDLCSYSPSRSRSFGRRSRPQSGCPLAGFIVHFNNTHIALRANGVSGRRSSEVSSIRRRHVNEKKSLTSMLPPSDRRQLCGNSRDSRNVIPLDERLKVSVPSWIELDAAGCELAYAVPSRTKQLEGIAQK